MQTPISFTLSDASPTPGTLDFTRWNVSAASGVAEYRSIFDSERFPSVYNSVTLSVRPATKTSATVKHRVKATFSVPELINSDNTNDRLAGQLTFHGSPIGTEDVNWMSGKVLRTVTFDLSITSPEGMTTAERNHAITLFKTLLSGTNTKPLLVDTSPLY